MKITLTVREIWDRDIWMEVCELTGMNEWACKEGLIEYDEEIEFTEEQAKKLGLIPEKWRE